MTRLPVYALTPGLLKQVIRRTINIRRSVMGIKDLEARLKILEDKDIIFDLH